MSEQTAQYVPLDNVLFPWNDVISMTNDSEHRAVVLCLSAVFDAIQGLRADLRIAAQNEGSGS